MKVKYSKELLEPLIKESYSIAEVIRKLGLKAAGGNYKTINKKIQEFNLDISHFIGQRWNKGKSFSEETAIYPLDEVLQKNVIYSSNTLKNRLIKNNLKENKCEVCGISGEDVILELHHINGNHYDNRLENLQLLCPNCHSKTTNFRNRNQSNTTEARKLEIERNHLTVCENCGKEFYSDRLDKKRRFCCRECYNEFLNKVGTLNKEYSSNSKVSLSEEVLKELCEKYSNITQIAEKTGYTRPTIRKYLEKFNLLNEFKSKYDFKAVRVYQCDVEGNVIKEWPSLTDAADSLKIDLKDISKCINHKRRSAGGYVWKKV